MSPTPVPALQASPTPPAGQPHPQRRRWLAGIVGLGASMGGLGGCAGLLRGQADARDDPHSDTAHAAVPEVVPFSSAAPGAPPEGWRPYVLRRDLTRTRYSVVREGTQRVLHAQARASATGLRCAVRIDPAERSLLRFSWKVRQVPGQADVSEAHLDDSPARLIVAFDGDHNRLPLRERLLYDQVELFTGQRLPFATLMYVWDGGRHAVESVHRNHRTTRIQYLTVQSGDAGIGHWHRHQRDVVADYQRVYGEAPGPVIGVGVLTDGDALKLQLEAWYGDITLSPAARA